MEREREGLEGDRGERESGEVSSLIIPLIFTG